MREAEAEQWEKGDIETDNGKLREGEEGDRGETQSAGWRQNIAKHGYKENK